MLLVKQICRNRFSEIIYEFLKTAIFVFLGQTAYIFFLFFFFIISKWFSGERLRPSWASCFYVIFMSGAPKKASKSF